MVYVFLNFVNCIYVLWKKKGKSEIYSSKIRYIKCHASSSWFYNIRRVMLDTKNYNFLYTLNAFPCARISIQYKIIKII